MFYDYYLSVNGETKYYGDYYSTDYLPDLITNTSLNLMSESTSPFFMLLSYPSCHEPADPAPQYAKLYDGLKAPRTQGWNKIYNNTHWLVSVGGVDGPMNSSMIEYSDLLYRRRILTLLSVDDAIERIIQQLKNTSQLDNTFIIYTSDKFSLLIFIYIVVDIIWVNTHWQLIKECCMKRILECHFTSEVQIFERTEQ